MTGEVVPGGRRELRASHKDRDRIVEQLRVAAGDGRLTVEELDERVEAALVARTYGELEALVVDLPATGSAAPVPTERRDLVRIDCGSGNARRDGQWVVPRRMEVAVTSGNVKLDFTRALWSEPVLDIQANVKSGNLFLITRPGIMVDTDDVAIKSGNVNVRSNRQQDVEVRLRIRVSGRVCSGNLIARFPRRTLWQWLLRRPKPYERSTPPALS